MAEIGWCMGEQWYRVGSVCQGGNVGEYIRKKRGRVWLQNLGC